MAVISILRKNGKSITKAKNKTIKNISVNETNYHFANANEVADGVCENSVNEPLIDMQIQGNSSQDGTPTPETPIEIESVGEKTKNLLDISKAENGTVVTASGQNLESVDRCRTDFIYLTKGTYCVSCLNNIQLGSYVHKYSSTSQTDWISAIATNAVTYEGNKTIRPFTLDEDCYVRFIFLPVTNSGVSLDLEFLKTCHPQLEQGTTATEYEPYGYGIPIVSRGKNLLDVSKAETGSLVSADGSNYDAINRARSPFVYLKKGNYTISMSSDIRATTMFFYSKPEPRGYFIGKYATTPAVENGIRFATFSVEQDCYMRCVFVPEDESKITDLGATTLSNYNVMIAETKNLFDISKAENGTINQNNGTDLSADIYPNRCRSGFIKLSVGSYIISFSELISTGNYLHCYSSDNVSSWIKSQTFTKSGSVSKFTLDSDCYIRFTVQPIDTSSSLVLNTETLKQYQPQLLKSITATDYESYIIPKEYNIYVKEPLRKIGEFADVLDFKNKKIIRKIASEFLTTVTTMSGDATTYRKFLTDIKYKPYLTYYNNISQGIYSIGYAISNKFKQSAYYYNILGNNPNFIQSYITTGGINRCVYTFDDKSVQATAKAQELIGDGFEVCYVMASPIEETIEVPEIMTFYGTTTFDVDTVLEPSGLSVKYWKQI